MSIRDQVLGARGQGKKTNVEYRITNNEFRSIKNKLRDSIFDVRYSIFVFRKCLLNIIMITLLAVPSFAVSDDRTFNQLTIYTVNYPLKYFAGRIAREHATVVFPAPRDVDPAYWMPDRKIISDYQKADLILLNGAHYAKWIEKVTLQRSRMVDTSRKFKDRYIKTDEAVTHSHGPEGKHAHEDIAFTIWLDFDIAAGQAKAITDALSRKRPLLKDTFQKNYTALEKDLKELDGELREIIWKDNTRPIVVSHPVYDYLAHRYGLNIKSVHWEPDEVPGNAQLMELRNILKNHPAQWMIWEGKPLRSSVEKLKSIGVRSIVFDPCGNVPELGDFLGVMRVNIKNLKKVYR